MNDTILALLSALAIYGLANFALPRSGWDTGDDDASVRLEDTAEIPPAEGTKDQGPRDA